MKNIKKSESINYTVFDKDSVNTQFENIKRELTSDMLSDEIISLFHKRLVNSAVLTKTYDKEDTDIILYRVSKKFPGFDEDIKQSYSYPPKPKQQRANIAGKPVLYTSIDVLTALSEMKDSIEIDEVFYISKWRISFNKPVIAHTLILNSTTTSSQGRIGDVSRELIQVLSMSIKNIPKKLQEGYIEAIKQLGDLYATPSDLYYHITSAYSDNILYTIREQKAFVDMLIFPSVANNQKSINYAIHPGLADSDQMALKEVYKVELKKNSLKSEENSEISLGIIKKGVFSEDNEVEWRMPTSLLTKAHFDELQLLTYNETIYKGKEAYSKKINNQDITIKNWLQDFLKNKNLLNLEFKHSFSSDIEDVLEMDVIQEEQQLIMDLKHGTEIETPNGISCVKRLIIPIVVKNEYSALN